MGEAKRRRAEIERLKSLPTQDAALREQAADDEKKLRRGIDPRVKNDPSAVLAMSRRLHSHFEAAKNAQSVDAAVRYLYGKIDATVSGLRDIPVACGKGCAHCCINLWVSISAPEAIYVARLVAAMGEEAVARVRAAHDATRHFSYEERGKHPIPCPMLQNNACLIYEHRPKVCRQAASTDAQACARSYRFLPNDVVPMPVAYFASGATYVLALYAALARAGLPNGSYEFNAAVVRVLDTPDAEKRWLAGEDIFAGVLAETVAPGDFYAQLDFIGQNAFAE